MPPSRSRLLPALLTVAALVVGALALVVVPPGGAPPARAAERVAKDECRRIDPNLVNGACLRYHSSTGSGLTWIGTYRAPDGRVFFCIDFLYDSRLPERAERVSTQGLVNQLGGRVGDAEVAALNYLVSRWAGSGSTGSDDRDAAIALVVREVMGDGVRPGGLEVYPGQLHVGERVRPPVGGLDGRVLGLARRMWRVASVHRGPYEMTLDRVGDHPVRLGQARRYRLVVTAASGRRVDGVRVRFACAGPVRCPGAVTTSRRATSVRLRPLDTGRFRVVARASLPSTDAVLYRQHGWSTHGGDTALPHGVQRGWIAQDNRVRASAGAEARVRRARPEVVTRTSSALVRPGAEIHDVVTVSGLPDGYAATVRADLFGPYAEQPGRDDCRRAERAGRVTFEVDGGGTYSTPPVTVSDIGYYTWVETLPGDVDTLATTTPCGLVEETTLVEPFRPAVRTTVSSQRSEVGDAVHDEVVVSGVADTPVTLEWTLYGPRADRGPACRDVSWVGAPVVATGTMEVPGDGTYLTPPVSLARAGCHTYGQRVLPTPLSEEAVSPPGLVTETTVTVRRTPLVTTEASEQEARVGGRIHDTIRVDGLRATDRVRVHWRLLGPLTPRGRSCRDLKWDDAPVADRGELVATGNGPVRTGATQLTAPGCYTYSAWLPPTAATDGVVSEPGIPAETALVTRPVTPYVPEVPTGRVLGGGAPAALRLVEDERGSRFEPRLRATPRYLRTDYRAPAAPRSEPRAGTLVVERVGVRVGVLAVGLDRGAMAVPDSRHRMGWLSTTAARGDLIGSSVLSGHVSGKPGGLGGLRRVVRGDVVRWAGADGAVRSFVVSGLRRFPRGAGLPAEMFRTDGRRTLHLVTCAGLRREADGDAYYVDNLVVTARAVR